MTTVREAKLMDKWAAEDAAAQQLPKRKHDGAPRVTGFSRAAQRADTMSQTAVDVAENTELRQMLNALESLADLQEQLDKWKAITVEEARMHYAGEHSWAEIGTALGVTRQAAQQRYGAKRS